MALPVTTQGIETMDLKYSYQVEQSQPFTIFTIPEFIEKETFDDCFRHFPSDLSLFLSDNRGKHRIENFSPAMARLKALPQWKSIFARFQSRPFFNAVMALDNGRQDLVPFSLNPITNFINIHLLGKTPYYISFEFSIIEPGGSIAPHTDSKNKIVTMMLYFPTKGQASAKGLGTDFYDFDAAKTEKYENYDNVHNDAGQFPEFENDSQVTFTSQYDGRHLVGFFRNAYSWHSVTIEAVPDDGKRRSLNVNYYYGPRSAFWYPLSQLKAMIKKNFF